MQKSNLFHGDLSPSNIMITKEGSVKLIDFANHYNSNYLKYGHPDYLPEDHKAGKHRGIQTDFEALDLMFPLIGNANLTRQEVSSYLSPYLTLETDHGEATTVLPKVASKWLAASFIGLLVLTLVSSQKLVADVNGVRVNISAKNWYYVSVEKEIQGYLPLSFTTKRRSFRLKWQGAQGFGDLDINIPSDKTKVTIDLAKILQQKQ